MALFNFSCPHCTQVVQADDQWTGQQIQCPTCAGAIIVPQNAAATPPPPPPAPAPSAPQKPVSKLKVTAAPHAPAPPAPPAPPSMPRPNYAAARPKPKKSGDAAKWTKIGVMVVVFGVGAYFLFGLISNWQSKLSADKGGSDGGQVGHINALNDVLDRTDPDHMGMSSKEAAVAKREEAKYKARMEAEEKRYQQQETNGGIDPQQGNAVANATADMATMPLASGTWSLDLDSETIPEGKANGMITGTNFVVDTAVLVKVGVTHILTLREGTNALADRELFVTLPLNAGEQMAGHTWNITKDMKGKGVPQVIKRWKTNPRYAASKKAFPTGYAMKLEFGQATNGIIPGKISVSLPDPESSYVVGSFKAALVTPGE